MLIYASKWASGQNEREEQGIMSPTSLSSMMVSVRSTMTRPESRRVRDLSSTKAGSSSPRIDARLMSCHVTSCHAVICQYESIECHVRWWFMRGTLAFVYKWRDDQTFWDFYGSVPFAPHSSLLLYYKIHAETFRVSSSSHGLSWGLFSVSRNTFDILNNRHYALFPTRVRR